MQHTCLPGDPAAKQNRSYNEIMDIRRIIADSFSDAIKALVMGTSPAALARARERIFVKALAAQLEDACEYDDVRVFSVYGRGNLADFGSERLLYDICLCRIGNGQTAGRATKDFLYIADTLWQIEIDYSREWQIAIQAINRLNGGCAANKLLVAAQTSSAIEAYKDTLRIAFAAGSGNIYLALIPHPADWDDTEAAPEVWRLVDGEWIEAE